MFITLQYLLPAESLKSKIKLRVAQNAFSISSSWIYQSYKLFLSHEPCMPSILWIWLIVKKNSFFIWMNIPFCVADSPCTARQNAVPQELYDSGMTSTGKSFKDKIRQAMEQTGLSEEQVKVRTIITCI